MIIRIGCEAYLFHLGGLALGLHFLFLLLLIVKELIVVCDLTNRRICIRGDLHEIKLLRLRNFQRFLGRINTYLYIVSNQPYLGSPDEMIDAMFCFLAGNESSFEASAARSVKRSVR